jgi:hypothetical protein
MLNPSISRNLFDEHGQLTVDAKEALVEAITAKMLGERLAMVVHYCDVRFEDITSRSMNGREQVVAVIDHFQKTKRLKALLKEIQSSNQSFAEAFSRGPYSEAIKEYLESETPDDATTRSKIIDDASSAALDSEHKLTEAGLNILEEAIGQSFDQRGFSMQLYYASILGLDQKGDTYLALRTRAINHCECAGNLPQLLTHLHKANPRAFISRLKSTAAGSQIVAHFCPELNV